MYSIYADGVCIHNDVFALDKMKAVNPKLTLSDCAAGSLTMTLPSINVGYETIERMITDITVEKDGKEIWMGRVLSETKDFWNNRVLYCEGELAFFNDSTQPPKQYSGLSIRGYLEALIAVHNSKVGANRQFQLGAVTVNDDQYPDRYTNYEKTMALLNDLIEKYGGHMRIRKENGVRYLDYLEECPNTCSQTIQMGVNLIDFTKSWDSTEFATVIVPLGARLDNSPIEELDAYLTVADVNGGSIYVQSDDAIKAYGWIEKTVQFDDVTDPAVLLEKAKAYLSDLQFDNMVLELSALDMHYLDVDTEAVKLLDEIRVISLPHGLDRLFPVTQLEIPLDSPEKTQFKLGDTVQTSLTAVNNQTNAAILERIEALPKAHNILKEAKENATAIMNMATTGYITITKDQYGSETLYISNVRDYTKADKLWKWNMNGLGYSKDGGKTYGLAITMDGSIVADYITTGTMSANRVRTGILESVNKNTVFNLDTGELTMTKGSIKLGKFDSSSKHYMFEVDNDGNIYAGSGTFAGTLAGAKGTFAGELIAATGTFTGVVRASDFVSSLTGQSMLKDGKFTSKYLDLYGLTVTNPSTGQTTFAISSTGAVTVNGKVTMGAGSTINWAQVTNTNLNSNPAYSLASSASATANQASADADDAYDLADAAYKKATSIKMPDYIKSTYIDATTIMSPTLMGASIYFGEGGVTGSLTRGYGNDGQNWTNLVQMISNYGIVLDAATNMRFEANSLWINISSYDVHVKHNGRWMSLVDLIEAIAPKSSS